MTVRRASCAARLLAALLPIAGMCAQAEPTPFEKLQEELRATPRPTREQRRELVRTFLAGAKDEKARPALEAHLLLGSYDLQELDGAAAKARFRRVVDLAEGHPAEIRARALYGLHQAQRLDGEPEAARDTLRELLRAVPGTPFAACARIALNHLDEAPPGVGDPIPLLQMGRDLQGRPVASTRAQPRMFVFWSLEHEPSVRRLEELSLSWQRAGMPASSLIAFALESDTEALRLLIAQRRWQFTVLPADQGFLQPDWLALGVHAVPSVLLIGRDDTLLARDVSADRLQVMLTEGG